MKTSVFFTVIVTLLISGCCPKVDDCHCVEVAILVCHFNNPKVYTTITAVTKDGKTKLDSITLSSGNPFTFTLDEDDFINKEISLTNVQLVFHDFYTNKSDTLQSFGFNADTITSTCNECWIRKPEKITCTLIHSYELVFNKQKVNSNEITIKD